jgi:hypothetical protein
MVPAQCERCGFTWSPPRAISVAAGASNVTFKDVFTRCPQSGCGGRARFIEGTFDFGAEGVTVVKGPERSRDILSALKLLKESAERGDSAEQVLEMAEAIDPDLAAALKPASGDQSKLLVLLIYLIAKLAMDPHIEIRADNWFSATVNNYYSRQVEQPRMVAAGEPAYRSGQRAPRDGQVSCIVHPGVSAHVRKGEPFPVHPSKRHAPASDLCEWEYHRGR